MSSARVVRCWVKSCNERNPCCQLPALLGTLARLPVTSRRKAGMTSNHHALMTWATHVLQWTEQREAKPRGGAKPIKLFSVRLQSATRLHEDGIASNRESACRGEYVLGPCTPPVTP